MGSVIKWLASPFVKIGGIILAGLSIVGIIYGKGRSDARSKIEGEAYKDANERLSRAVRAGDSVDTSPDGLRKDDGHKRD